MQRTVTALFDNASAAAKARQHLIDADVPASAIDVIGDGQSMKDEKKGGFFSGLKNLFVSDEDREVYKRGIERGHVLLSVRADEDKLDSVIAKLDASDAIDIDTADWARSGSSMTAPGAMGSSAAGATTTAPMASTTTSTPIDDEARIPIVEEQLVVGKRAVDKGGARVRTYVVETPVSEDVRLREERVSVERVPVNERVSDPDALFREQTIEVSGIAEEAVVGKEARVVEEVVVRKNVGERVEQVSDTVRRTEVEVDRGASPTDAPASGVSNKPRRGVPPDAPPGR